MRRIVAWSVHCYKSTPGKTVGYGSVEIANGRLAWRWSETMDRKLKQNRDKKLKIETVLRANGMMPRNSRRPRYDQNGVGVLGLLLVTQPALACRHYRSWSYPWPQSCRVTSAAPVRHRAWFVDVAPTPVATPPAPAPVVEAPVVNSEVIETLNEELRWRAANSLTLEEKHNGD